MFAIHRALRILDERGETGANCSAFTDFAAAMRRAATDSLGPGQALAKAIITTAEHLHRRRCSTTLDGLQHTKGWRAMKWRAYSQMRRQRAQSMRQTGGTERSKLCPPDQKSDGETVPGHKGLNLQQCQARSAIPPFQGRDDRP